MAKLSLIVDVLDEAGHPVTVKDVALEVWMIQELIDRAAGVVRARGFTAEYFKVKLDELEGLLVKLGVVAQEIKS